MKIICENRTCVYNSAYYGCARTWCWPNKPFEYCPEETAKNVEKELKRRETCYNKTCVFNQEGYGCLRKELGCRYTKRRVK